MSSFDMILGLGTALMMLVDGRFSRILRIRLARAYLKKCKTRLKIQNVIGIVFHPRSSRLVHGESLRRIFGHIEEITLGGDFHILKFSTRRDFRERKGKL